MNSTVSIWSPVKEPSWTSKLIKISRKLYYRICKASTVNKLPDDVTVKKSTWNATGGRTPCFGATSPSAARSPLGPAGD